MERCEVLIVGAGPVGLLLGCLLARRNVDVRVVEASTRPAQDSRAIGIHPLGLRCLGRLGLSDTFVAEGVTVERGHYVVPVHALPLRNESLKPKIKAE